MLSAIPILNNNSLLNTAMAQGYDDYSSDSYYSQDPTDDKKYECRTGPFEGFFVSSVEFCKFKFDKDDNSKNNRDTGTGTQGPPGPPGPEGPPGATGATGAQGPAGPGASLVQCPEDSLLAGVNVTDTALCNLVNQENKECQVCVPLSITPFQPETAGFINNAINDFPGGLGGICTSDDPITTYGTVIRGIDELGPVTHDTIIDSFTDCVNAAGVTSQSISGSQLSVNNSPLQTSNIQSSNESTISSQNVEVNKNIEQMKNTAYPLFNPPSLP